MQTKHGGVHCPKRVFLSQDPQNLEISPKRAEKRRKVLRLWENTGVTNRKRLTCVLPDHESEERVANATTRLVFQRSFSERRK